VCEGKNIRRDGKRSFVYLCIGVFTNKITALPYRYRRKIRSVHFGIKKGAVPPFSLKRGAMAPFLRSLTPFWKRGEERGEVYKKGGDRYRPKYRKSSKSDTGKIPIPKKLLVTPRYTTLDFWDLNQGPKEAINIISSYLQARCVSCRVSLAAQLGYISCPES
jgi:hypothetical protein